MTPKVAVTIYTDGACSGNPGPGGFGVILEAEGHSAKELSAGYRLTTNNRMELRAVIAGLKALKSKNVDVTIVTDSKYVADAVIQGWVFSWHKKGFVGKKNPDLWKEYLAQHQIYAPKIEWIKGHNNHPQNDRCDKLAVDAAKRPTLLVDEWFENHREDSSLFPK